jgi:lysylphosphatidylglycerol synthetase-like protein (DUF2156 family)
MDVQGLSWRRALICLPPAVLTSLGVLMLIMAPATWGKGDHVDLPSWMPTLATVIFGVSALGTGGLFLRAVVRRTRGSFTVTFLLLAATLVAIAAAIAIEAGLLLRVTSSGTYDSLRNDDGSINTTPVAFMVFTVIGVLVMSAAVALAAFLYRQAITPENHRYERASDEPDVMYELLNRPPGRPY